MNQRTRKALASAVLMTFVPLSSMACFGSFQLTRKLYQFNREVSADRWVRWAVFAGMALFPVYAAGLVVDGLFGNAIEFWGGRNPFAMVPGTTHVATGPAGEELRVTVLEPGVLGLELRDAAGELHRLRLVQARDGVLAYDAAGVFLGRVTDVAGQPQLLAAPR